MPHEMNVLLQMKDIDIVCITETWLDADIGDRYLLFPGYCAV